MEDKRIVKVYLDDENEPFGSFKPPVKFDLDTTKIADGKHKLKIVAKSSSGVEGIKEIPFEVKNGPEISVIGLKNHEIVDSTTSITINAYGSETNDEFVIKGSETPKAIPAWVWAIVIAFIGFALFYLIMYWDSDLYNSFF
ncbi:cytochrome C [Marivirga harenae]|uniref:cytochrome C n=1 Tax=Marivirga harenae TaxID=2010992 RepID=UPI0026DF0CE8|nr:cytochrome C [Marivirga harenae]WKV12963.1 cytochrome C [Marivirga harenae]|tara:strand:- start:80426 stop:80848 length:423 start_codon:yes stop_codon:yes gene_type:complete